jgi:ABC-2 type transport system ATP-binding protein
MMIRTRELRKQFGQTIALDGVDLEIPARSVYGFIGENGAGKTTTIRILATLGVPDSGVAEVGGFDVQRHPFEARRLIGYMPDFFGVYDGLKAGEYLRFYAGLQGLRGPNVTTLCGNLLELVDLAHKRDAYVDTLSRGMQQRLCLARSLIHDPQVLLLDEPASGLDPIARAELRELLRELGRMGKTILLSSHILSEIEGLCTHVGLLAGGRMLRQGSITDVLAGHGQGGYVLRVLSDAPRACAILEDTEAVTAISANDREIRFQAEPGPEAAALALAAVAAAGIPVAHFSAAPHDLEAAFLPLVRAGKSKE